MKDTRTPSEQVDDGYNKVAFGIPYDRELETMNYKQLSVELEKSEKESARHSVIAHEMEKRKPGGVGWIHRHGSALLLGIFGSLIASVLWFYYWHG